MLHIRGTVFISFDPAILFADSIVFRTWERGDNVEHHLVDIQTFGLAEGVADGLTRFERRAADEDVKFDGDIVFLKQTDSPMDILRCDTLLDILQYFRIKGFNTEVDIAATALAQEAGYGFGDGIDTGLTSPDYAGRTENITYSCRLYT